MQQQEQPSVCLGITKVLNSMQQQELRNGLQRSSWKAIHKLSFRPDDLSSFTEPTRGQPFPRELNTHILEMEHCFFVARKFIEELQITLSKWKAANVEALNFLRRKLESHQITTNLQAKKTELNKARSDLEKAQSKLDELRRTMRFRGVNQFLASEEIVLGPLDYHLYSEVLPKKKDEDEHEDVQTESEQLPQTNSEVEEEHQNLNYSSSQ
ncbi:hypothetical protein ACH5RR_012987 [Cinchona calisaya]|uniref:Uncharacterized protein n=1 Tax=Cinchona calisaya TaxID=153742 RepID=A0ABD2ZYS6_9GENT